MVEIDFDSIPKSVRIELCVAAINGTAEAMKTPEGRAAVEKGRQEYLRHLAECERDAGKRN